MADLITEEFDRFESIYETINEMVSSPMLMCLNEGTNLAPHVAELFERFKEAVFSVIKDGENHIKLNESIFHDIPIFFEKADLEFNILISKQYFKPTYDLHIIPQIKPENSEKYPLFNLVGWVKSDFQHLQNILASAFYHEYHHMYEDYCRQMQYPNNNLRNYSMTSDYWVTKTMIEHQNKYVRAFGYILYHISQIEQRGFIAGGIGEVREYLRWHKWIRKAPKLWIMKQTRNYQNVIKIKDNLKVLRDCKDLGEQKNLLDWINFSHPVKGMVYNDEKLQAVYKNDFSELYKNKVKTYRFGSYYGLLKFITYHANKAVETYINAISKAIDEVRIGDLYTVWNYQE